jgi:hypothetical protein
MLLANFGANNPNNSTFLPPSSATSTAAEVTGRVAMPTSGFLRNMTARVSATPAGTITLTLRINGADSTSCTISGTTSCTSAATVAVAQGDLVTVRYAESVANNVLVNYSFIYSLQ